jgi:LysR family transcriptional activator of nhaA
LLAPALHLEESVRVIARAGKFEDLLTELVSFDLDIVLSDAPITSGSRIKAFNHLLGECGMTFFGSHKLAARYGDGFPASLSDAPLLLPPASSVARRSLDQWLDERGFRPRIVGEFHDSALMKVFGQEGLGLFPAPSAIEEGVCRQYAVQPIGRIPEIRERFYAISVDRRLRHPAVIKISQAAKTQVFTEQQPTTD